MCTAVLIYRILDEFTREVISSEKALSFDIPANGWKRTVHRIEDEGARIGRIIVKYLLPNAN